MGKLPASIRNRNPGAMYPGPSSRKFGARAYEVIGGGHSIATFPTMVAGGAAHFDLLHRVYTGKTIEAAIAKWSGGNNVNDYLAVIEAETDYDRGDYLTKQLVEKPDSVIQVAKAMAKHEAGLDYPMTDEQWSQAHAAFLAGEAIKPEKVKPMLTPYEYALTKLGEKEVAGPGSNPFITECYAAAGHDAPETLDDGKWAWCSAFMAMCCLHGGAKVLETLLARHWLKYGPLLDEPEEGCIGVKKRGNSTWQGHVFFVKSWTATTVEGVGGNQSDAVTIDTFKRSEILGYVRPVPALKPVTQTVAESKSLPALMLSIPTGLVAFFTNLFDVLAGWFSGGADVAWNSLGWMVGLAPKVIETADTHLGPVQSLALRFGLPFPVKVAAAAMITTAAVVLVREFNRKRAQ